MPSNGRAPDHFICPVCHTPVEQTTRENISGHSCNNGDACPGSFQPFRIAIKVSIPQMTTKRRERTRLLSELRTLQRRANDIINQLSMLDQQ